MSERTDEILTTIFGGILFTLTLVGMIALIAVTHGFVLSTLWGWFLVPLGLPTIGLTHAIGLTLVVRYLTHHHNKCKHKDQEEKNPLSKLVARVFAYPLAVLFVGWFIHLFL